MENFVALQDDSSVIDSIKLIDDLNELAAKKLKRGGVKKIINTIHNTSIPITSWKFNEWDYGYSKVQLPTNARGLFTLDNVENREKKIVCRGYDKFFSLDETAETQMSVLREETQGPYYLTVKSNGCIAFISGLEDGTLVVCSKHSTGVRNDLSKNHALAAEAALELQLSKNGLNKVELAKWLFKLNLTAVCEFCDDSFEEHVLEYDGEKAGLYLHGLNLNVNEFTTYPLRQVNVFADAWGFKKTEYIECLEWDKMITLLEEMSSSGKYNGEEVEGFVVRCKRVKKDKKIDYFFKYKFKEPYFLYRELREVTKQYLSRHKIEDVQIGRHTHKLICLDYLKFVIPLFQNDPKLEENFLMNKGIVKLRKLYFQSKDKDALSVVESFQKRGENDLNKEMNDLCSALGTNTIFPQNKCKYLLIPIATIGCGKTTTTLTIKKCFPKMIGHVQNDDIPRPVKDKLMRRGLELLMEKDIVTLDKNNHKYIERKQVFDEFETVGKGVWKRLNSKNEIGSPVKIIALNFLPRKGHSELPIFDQQLWNITKSRVSERGDDHQSINFDSNPKETEAIMKGFLSRFQPVNSKYTPDNQFDEILDLNVGENSSFENAKIILDYFIKEGVLPSVEDKQIELAFEEAKSYRPSTKKFMGKNNSKKNKTKNKEKTNSGKNKAESNNQKLEGLIKKKSLTTLAYEFLVMS
ncbi:tRNA ligase [Martiniozyma asiatica (nom. inval.)]|nr:tRNA ligase [Martiniozyma asiatica]